VLADTEARDLAAGIRKFRTGSVVPRRGAGGPRWPGSSRPT